MNSPPAPSPARRRGNLYLFAGVMGGFFAHRLFDKLESWPLHVLLTVGGVIAAMLLAWPFIRLRERALRPLSSSRE
jgi:hypothetical protein